MNLAARAALFATIVGIGPISGAAHAQVSARDLVGQWEAIPPKGGLAGWGGMLFNADSTGCMGFFATSRAGQVEGGALSVTYTFRGGVLAVYSPGVAPNELLITLAGDDWLMTVDKEDAEKGRRFTPQLFRRTTRFTTCEGLRQNLPEGLR